MLVCMLCPVWGTYLWIWIHAIRSREKKSDKAKYILMLMTNMAFVPVFALMNDWGAGLQRCLSWDFLRYWFWHGNRMKESEVHCEY